MRHIRTAARALIIRDQSVLTIKMRDPSGIFYILPGGGQHHGETLRESLVRECAEEIGTGVEVGDLAYVREYIGKNHTFSAAHKGFHQVEHVFHCTLPEPGKIGGGSAHDKKQVGLAWLPIEQLDDYRLLPSILRDCFAGNQFVPAGRYLGDTN